MHAVIPVAGFGSRLRPHTHTVPKVLLEVAGKPILGHIIERLTAAGVESMTIVIGHLGEQIREYVTASFPALTIDFKVQEELHGLGHSIWTARESIPIDGRPLFIILGDTIFGLDLCDFLSLPTNAIGAKEVDDPRRFGVIELQENGMVAKLVEKPMHPTSNLAIVGLYLIRNPKLLVESLNNIVSNDRRTRNEYQLTDALQMMIEAGEAFTAYPIEAWYDCGKPETLLSTNRHLLDELAEPPSLREGCVINPPVAISPSARISNSIIGPYASIGANAIIENSIITNSIIGAEASIHQIILDETIIGPTASVIGQPEYLNLGSSSTYGKHPS